MKHAKKIFCLLLALMMVFSLSITAFATERSPEKVTETVTNKSGHDYKAYQVFSGSQATDLAPLGDVQWGSGVNGDALLAAIKADKRFGEGDANIFKDCETAAAVAKELASHEDGSFIARAFANDADQHRTNVCTPIPKAADGTAVTQVQLEVGYWLLVDVTEIKDGTTDALNQALLQLTNKGGLVIETKYGIPTVDKNIIDSNNNAVKASDYSIGDLVSFRLTGTMASNYLAYEHYFYQFNDTLCNALDYQSEKDDDFKLENELKVTLITPPEERDAARENFVLDITDSFTITEAPGTNKEGEAVTNLTIKCEDLLAIPDAKFNTSSTIVVDYTAKLTANAKTGSAGNPNTVSLTFSNNPNAGGEGSRSTTPEKGVLVFTYVLDCTKVDAVNANIVLSGAEFVLLDKDQAKVAKLEGGKIVSWDDKSAIAVNKDGTYPAAYTMTSDGDGKFNATGLDSGTYYLLETKAPAGYNKSAALTKVLISSSITTTDPGSLDSLTIQVGESSARPGDLGTGTVAAQISNGQGNVLPVTGGIGTTIFYVVGSILLIGAAVLLITKKRMSASK